MSAPRRSWRAHVLLAALALTQFGLWSATHRTTPAWEVLWRASGAGPTEDAAGERGRALHVLTSRADTHVLGRTDTLARELLAAPDPRLRALAFSADVCKLGSSRPQLEAVLRGLDERRPGALHDFLLQCRKVGGEAVGSTNAMQRIELDWAFDDPVDSDTEWARAIEHLRPWTTRIREHLNQ